MKRLFEIDLHDYGINDKVFRRPSARGIIFDDCGRLALVYSKKEKFYKFPGGGIQDDEDKKEALIREVREETGLVVVPESIEEFGSVLRRQKDDKEPKVIFEQENFYYLCKVENKIVGQNLDDYEAEDMAWMASTINNIHVGTVSEVYFADALFIGDSRTCQMQASTGGGKCKWICEYGSKYDWFSGTAVPAADAMIGSGTKVVICMGINDPENYDSYISLVNGKAIDWTGRGAKVYYVSLNPVDSPYDFKNYAIDVFNSEVPSRLGNVKWIDTASALKQSGYTLEDGIHYDTATNIKIYNLICGSL